MIELSTTVIGARLKQLREQKGLSHDKLAKELQVKFGNDDDKKPISTDSLKAYEVTDCNHSKYGNQKGMKIENFIMLANYYNVSLDYLLGIEDETSHNMKYVCSETKLKEETIRKLKGIPAFAHIIDYIANGLLPYMDISEISSLFNCIEKYISSENDNRESALNMLEIQQIITKVRIDINNKFDEPRKRLF